MEEGGGAIFHEEKASPARRKRLKFKKKTYVSFVATLDSLYL